MTECTQGILSNANKGKLSSIRDTLSDDGKMTIKHEKLFKQIIK